VALALLVVASSASAQTIIPRGGSPLLNAPLLAPKMAPPAVAKMDPPLRQNYAGSVDEATVQRPHHQLPLDRRRAGHGRSDPARRFAILRQLISPSILSS
jgi:hypothetical protein